MYTFLWFPLYIVERTVRMLRMESPRFRREVSESLYGERAKHPLK